jgi:hypothetical protein
MAHSEARPASLTERGISPAGGEIEGATDSLVAASVAKGGSSADDRDGRGSLTGDSNESGGVEDQSGGQSKARETCTLWTKTSHRATAFATLGREGAPIEAWRAAASRFKPKTKSAT